MNKAAFKGPTAKPQTQLFPKTLTLNRSLSN